MFIKKCRIKKSIIKQLLIKNQYKKSIIKKSIINKSLKKCFNKMYSKKQCHKKNYWFDGTFSRKPFCREFASELDLDNLRSLSILKPVSDRSLWWPTKNLASNRKWKKAYFAFFRYCWRDSVTKFLLTNFVCWTNPSGTLIDMLKIFSNMASISRRS